MVVEIVHPRTYVEGILDPNDSPPKQAFFVLGPEGSGTHMLRNALVEAGCSWKQGHESYQDDYHFEEMPSPFVFRRSLPHAGRWPRLTDMLDLLNDAGFSVHILFILRDFFATAKSVVHREYQGTIEDCYDNQRSAIIHFGSEMEICQIYHLFPITYITYEAFCLNEGFRKWLFEERLQLPCPENFQIFYSGDQYYG